MGEYIDLDKSIESRNGIVKPGKYHAHEWLGLLGLSAHFLIEPNGDVIKQRKTTEVCWHARGFNTGSVGIELLVGGVWDYAKFKKRIKQDWVNIQQLDTLVELSNNIIEYFNIDHKDVLRHSDISPERKKDPGQGMNWDWFKEQLV